MTSSRPTSRSTYGALRERAQNLRDWLTLSDDLVQAERTPFEVLAREGIAKLRHYAPLDDEAFERMGERVELAKERHPIPLVIVAPLAVNMGIYDLFPERSLVRTLLARGFSVYLVDWGSPSRDQDHHRLSTYFAELLPRFLGVVRAHSGSRQLSLHGWSFGGLFSYCYVAHARDEDVRNLVLVGAPCDYHANGELGLLYQGLGLGLRRLERLTGRSVHDARPSWFRVPGFANALGFKLTNPIGSIEGYVELARSLGDRGLVSGHATNASFIDRMEAYPGGVVQDFVQYLWAENRLARGELPMEGSSAKLSSIRSSVLAVVGRDDPIVQPACAMPLFDVIASDDREVLEVSGGHVGIVGGKRAPEESWGHIADWLAPRSGSASKSRDATVDQGC